MGNAVDTVLYAGMLNLEPVLCFVALMATFGSFVIGFDPTSLLDRHILYLHPMSPCSSPGSSPVTPFP
ncbi:MAG: hypothetical protein V8Q30_01405 [Acutalibacteraceae bacterium]